MMWTTHTHTAADTATNGDVSHPPGADYSLLTGCKMNRPLLCHWLWKGDRSSGRDKHTQVSLQDTAFGFWRRTFSNCHTNKNKCWECWREVIRSKNAMGAQEGDTVFVYLLDLFRGERGNVEDLLRLLQTHPGDAGGCGRLLRWLTPGLRCCLAGCKKKNKKTAHANIGLVRPKPLQKCINGYHITYLILNLCYLDT